MWPRPFMMLCMIKGLGALLFAVLELLATSSTYAFERENQVFGSYSKGGKISEGIPLPEQGTGFISLFRWRSRYFGSDGLIQSVTKVAEVMSRLYPDGEPMQIGDISKVHGGFISGHSSHQNGLDVDIAYFRADKQEQDKKAGGFPLQFVKRGRITNNFDLERNVSMAFAFVKTERVGRMLVDPVIKNAMCEYVISTGQLEEGKEMLRKLRPWPNHANHIHVRFDCPPGSPRCLRQSPIPSGTGCDAVKNPKNDNYYDSLLEID